MEQVLNNDLKLINCLDLANSICEDQAQNNKPIIKNVYEKVNNILHGKAAFFSDSAEVIDRIREVLKMRINEIDAALLQTKNTLK